jgi:putative membrane protein
VSGCFLGLGYWFIRHGRRTAHHRSMLTATVFAGAFLVVYVLRSVLIPTRLFPTHDAAYVVYLGILVPHVILAIAVGPLALITLARAFRGNFVKHRFIARITLPIWAFVAISGWVVYVMLYLIPWGS